MFKNETSQIHIILIGNYLQKIRFLVPLNDNMEVSFRTLVRNLLALN